MIRITLGKPEPLKYELSGLWSRRINKDHRLIYEITQNIVIIHSAKGHYS
jgi:toxin YoeB